MQLTYQTNLVVDLMVGEVVEKVMEKIWLQVPFFNVSSMLSDNSINIKL